MKSVRRYARSSQALGQVKGPGNYCKFALPISSYARVAKSEHNVVEVQRCLTHRGDVYDSGRGRRSQQRNKTLGKEIRGKIVHRKTKFISVLTDLSFGIVSSKTDSRIIHKDIKSRYFRYHLPCQVLHFSQRGKICPAKLNALVACRLLDFTHGFQTTLGVATVQKKRCAMFCQSLRERQAKAACRTGNQNRLFFDRSHVRIYPRLDGLNPVTHQQEARKRFGIVFQDSST